MAEIIQIDGNTWRIEDGFVRFFLLSHDAALHYYGLIDREPSTPTLTKNEDGLLKESMFERIKRGNNPEHESGAVFP